MSDEIITMYCNDPFKKGCHWQGAPGELVCTDADPKHFTHCPQCEGEDLTKEVEDDEVEDDE